MSVLAIDHLEETVWASWAFVSLCGMGLIVWLLIRCRRLSAGALDRLESLESTARDDRATLGGALSATTYSLGRLIERIARFEASVIQQQDAQEPNQYGDDKVVSLPGQPGTVVPHRFTRSYERRIQR